MFGVKSEDLRQANVIGIEQRVGKYFLKLTVNKELAQKTNLSEAIFGTKILIEEVTFIDAGEEILCGFLTELQQEKDIIELLKGLDSNLVKSAKFLRVEETNF